MRLGASLDHFANEDGMCFSYGFSGIRDFRTMTPSGRRSTAISRSSHSILRKAGFVKTAAAFPLMLSLPDWPLAGPWFFASMLAPDIDRLSLFQKGSDALVEILRAAAHHLIAVFHRNHGFERAGIDTHVEAFLRQPQTDRRGRHH